MTYRLAPRPPALPEGISRHMEFACTEQVLQGEITDFLVGLFPVICCCRGLNKDYLGFALYGFIMGVVM